MLNISIDFVKKNSYNKDRGYENGQDAEEHESGGENAQNCRRNLEQKGDGMQFYVLIYYVVDDYITRRAKYRDDHLRLAKAAQQRGELLLGGALTDPADRALLVFRAPARAVVEDFVRDDPYVTNGLVTRWEIRPWAVVIGQDGFDKSPKE